MKYLKVLFFLFLLVGTIIILRNHQPAEDTPYHVSEGRIFGTQYKVVYQHPAILDACIDSVLQRVDCSLSMFNKRSTLARINSGESNRVDSLFAEVFKLSLKVAEVTNGAFDPTIAPAVNAWGFGPKRRMSLTPHELDSIVALVGYNNVTLEGDTLLIRTDSRINLDFGAIAKGFAVDCVGEMLSMNGVANYMVEIGGEVVVKGVNEKGTNWRIGIQKPTTAETSVQEVVQLQDAAMATSGNYRNYYVNEAGERVAHTIDPRTSLPVTHSLLSATVIAPTCAIADAYATAFMVLGLDDAKQVLAENPELKVFFIYAEGDTLQYYSTLD